MRIRVVRLLDILIRATDGCLRGTSVEQRQVPLKKKRDNENTDESAGTSDEKDSICSPPADIPLRGQKSTPYMVDVVSVAGVL